MTSPAEGPETGEDMPDDEDRDDGWAPSEPSGPPSKLWDDDDSTDGMGWPPPRADDRRDNDRHPPRPL